MYWSFLSGIFACIYGSILLQDPFPGGVPVGEEFSVESRANLERLRNKQLQREKMQLAQLQVWQRQTNRRRWRYEIIMDITVNKEMAVQILPLKAFKIRRHERLHAQIIKCTILDGISNLNCLQSLQSGIYWVKIQGQTYRRHLYTDSVGFPFFLQHSD